MFRFQKIGEIYYYTLLRWTWWWTEGAIRWDKNCESGGMYCHDPWIPLIEWKEE